MKQTQSNCLLLVTIITTTIFGASAYAQQPVKAPFPAEVRTEKPSTNSLFDFGLPATRESQLPVGSGKEKSHQVEAIQTASSNFGVPPKQRGVIRIGLVSAASDAPEDQIQATIAKMGILINGVPGASPFDAVRLDSMLSYQITAEARAKTATSFSRWIPKVRLKRRKRAEEYSGIWFVWAVIW